MRIRRYPVILSVLLLAVTPGLHAEELVRKFSGSRSTNTVEFDVRAPWIIDWRVSGELSRVVAVDVAMFNAKTGQYEGIVLKTKTAGNGVKLFNTSGRYYFRVDASLMNWTLKVIQLTAKEAEQYTPKADHILDR